VIRLGDISKVYNGARVVALANPSPTAFWKRKYPGRRIVARGYVEMTGHAKPFRKRL